MSQQSALIKEAQSHLPSEEMALLQRAYERAQDFYGDSLCHTGQPCLQHAEEIVRLMLPLHPDMSTLVAALLQHVHGKENLFLVEEEFGKQIAQIISYVSLLNMPRTSALSPTYLRKMTLVLTEDIRVLLICLHNRWHLLQRGDSLEQKELQMLAREVLDVFAPISARLGVYSIKYELEGLAFMALYPEEAHDIEDSIRKIRASQGAFLTIGSRAIEKLLQREGINGVVRYREKHPYSIFQKMKRKSLSHMSDLHDLFGLRIVVESVDDCYKVLGIIHRTYRPIMHRAKDFISFAKPNGYRSLHTTVLGLNVKDPTMPIEIQIRTFEMDEEAEFGIAAHWSYKDQSKEKDQESIWQERMKALKQLFPQENEESEDRSDDDESADLSEAIADRIYVLTPRGDPIELPKGGTPLDFAFRIHTDIGLQFKFAKVNGNIAPIDHQLENGDMVEIQRQSHPKPSVHWIRIAKTREARQKMRNYFRTHGEAIAPAPKSQQEPISPLKRILPKKKISTAPQEAPKVLLPTDVTLPYRFAQCCKPDRKASLNIPIVGFATRDAIITIHKKGCRMLKDANPSRMIDASWDT